MTTPTKPDKTKPEYLRPPMSPGQARVMDLARLVGEFMQGRDRALGRSYRCIGTLAGSAGVVSACSRALAAHGWPAASERAAFVEHVAAEAATDGAWPASECRPYVAW